MSLQIRINDDLKEAMKAKKEPHLSTLRLLKSDIQYELTKTGAKELADDQVVSVIKKLTQNVWMRSKCIKRREEAIS